MTLKMMYLRLHHQYSFEFLSVSLSLTALEVAFVLLDLPLDTDVNGDCVNHDRLDRDALHI